MKNDYNNNASIKSKLYIYNYANTQYRLKINLAIITDFKKTE